jgi:oligopeptide/dipeptide ABC transporter ATP-binding protein
VSGAPTPNVLSTPPIPPAGADADAGAAAALLRVEDLKVYFPIKEGIVIERHVADVRAVDGVTFQVGRGETLGLVGESGCGKSTTGRAIVRLYDPTAGRILFDGKDVAGVKGGDLRRLRRRMQMIFQDPYASLNPRMTAGGIIGEPLDIHGVGAKGERAERVRDLLATVGLNPDYAVRYPHEFSGGQRQRIGVARALALEPELIVADEPISALDVSIQAQIINLLERLQGRLGLTYLFIAHDLSVVRHISDRIAVMYLGRIVEVARSRELNSRPLHPYAVALLSAVPIPDPVVESRRRRIILRGDVPSPVNPPSGCHFHTRCWLRERLGDPDRCVAEVPVLRELATGHEVACHFAEDVEGSAEQLQATGRAAPVAPSSPPPAVPPVPPSVPQDPTIEPTAEAGGGASA